MTSIKRPIRGAAHEEANMKTSERIACAHEGFSRIDVAEALKDRAAKNFARWLEEDTFCDARPQLEYLIEVFGAAD